MKIVPKLGVVTGMVTQKLGGVTQTAKGGDPNSEGVSQNYANIGGELKFVPKLGVVTGMVTQKLGGVTQTVKGCPKNLHI